MPVKRRGGVHKEVDESDQKRTIFFFFQFSYKGEWDHISRGWILALPNTTSCLFRNCRRLEKTMNSLRTRSSGVRKRSISCVSYWEMARWWQFRANSESPSVIIYVGDSTTKLGVVLLWKQEVSVSISSYSTNHVDVIMDVGSETAWRFTGFYGPRGLCYETRLGTYYSHYTLRTTSHGVALETFNEIVWIEEKNSRSMWAKSQM